MKNLRPVRWGCFYLLALFVINSHAAVIFDNGVPDYQTGVVSDFDSGQQAADNFVLQPGSATITDLHWLGVYGNTGTPSPTDNFMIRLFYGSGNVPGITPFAEFNVGDVGREATGDYLIGPGFAFEAFRYSATIPAFTLDAGITYWISIVNNTTSDPDDDWGWLTSDFIFGDGAYRAGTGVWTPAVEDFAFNLTGVPIVPPVYLLSSGMLGLIAIARRKKAKD